MRLVVGGHQPPLCATQITAQGFTFLLAGYETTANALAFTTYLLAHNPDKEAKMIEEIDAFGRDVTPGYDDLVKVRTAWHRLMCILQLPRGLAPCRHILLFHRAGR